MPALVERPWFLMFSVPGPGSAYLSGLGYGLR